MVALHECTKFLTVRQQKILLAMFDNGNRVSFKSQNVYSNNRSFKRAMRELSRAGCCSATVALINGKRCNEYKLTMNGELFVQTVIIEFNRCNT